jgi:hypothetical protein
MMPRFLGETTMTDDKQRVFPLPRWGRLMAYTSLVFRLILLFLICVGPWRPTAAQPSDIPSTAHSTLLTAEQVVQNLA